MKFEEDTNSPLDKLEFDALFDIYLRPLRSENARRIFKVLVEENDARALTTLDIQSKLKERGIRLSKKEINGWLHSLTAAGLVEKGVERGKPTTLEYHDKYTFDLWRLTDLGAKIAKGLPRILGTRFPFLEGDAEHSLKEISRMDREGKKQTIQSINDLYLLTTILQRLFEDGGEMKRINLMKKIRPAESQLDQLLQSYSNHSQGVNLIARVERRRGLRNKLLNILGLSFKKDLSYALTEEGRKHAKALLSGDDVGH